MISLSSFDKPSSPQDNHRNLSLSIIHYSNDPSVSSAWISTVHTDTHGTFHSESSSHGAMEPGNSKISEDRELRVEKKNKTFLEKRKKREKSHMEPLWTH
jgi:hypothetical protein